MSSENLGKIPPQNLEAEQSLLGSILIDNESFYKIADIINAPDFYKKAHEQIYENMMELYSRHDPIDLLTLTNLLDEKKLLEQVGGRSYLVNLTNSIATSSNIVNYAKIVVKKATLRRLLMAANKITNLGYQEDEDVDAIIDSAEQELFTVSQKNQKKSFVPISSVLTDAFDRIDDLHKNAGELRGVPTGFRDLDNHLAGLQKSDLVILAARPSVGKTSLALDIARKVAVESKISVGYFSLEMSKEQLVDRMLCAQSGIDLWKIRTGKLSSGEGDDDFQRLGHAMGVLSEAPIYIDDSAGLNIIDVRTKSRRLKMEKGLGLIVVDYMQLMEGRPGAENRLQAVSEISRGLKQIARELDIPILALSQLSRAVEMNKPAIPKLSHLRESGSIEQDADIVMFIYRKAADRNYNIEELTPEEKSSAEVHIAKHRNGPTGTIKFFFEGSQASFKTIEQHRNLPPGM
ncbi:replicative DNA helicase [Candidatus Falkowbacteria bacterium RIFOXYD2_FULL_35_9]|uniref:Replicative DNA helicase n=1 Tax=Candidatus Falkowbacteria bacterium RIFOXYC2_FULL_36_12 TaxID=1798002 RepID=A0A1F5T0K2_9BACT|nr:MAG: replicative DNA helicase [Candidatus Falkowbacteria bacterium RIFOXYC2_FULL_36_12]OGF47648.1 MAG: replicative DNA helicase [Candidatus Falkowbacteria bacterium RIFOXYD2_FULL_35_9]